MPASGWLSAEFTTVPLTTTVWEIAWKHVKRSTISRAALGNNFILGISIVIVLAG
jgi:hypothetical protein